MKYGYLGKYKEKDALIMAQAGELYGTVNDLKAINRVCTRHEDVNISNISSADGRRLNIIYLKEGACSTIRNTDV